ncbi:hypothetical protein QTP70_021536, partial [Hemibagrus guttatus]
KENEGPAKSTVQRQNSQEVREYMHQQILERRRRKQQMRRKVEFEQEMKRRSMQAIVKKQKEALHRTRKQQTQQTGKSRNADKEQFATSRKTLGLQHNAHCAVLDASSRTMQMELFSDAWSKKNNPVCLVNLNRSLIIPAKTQRYRVEALRKTIASLDARVDNETVRLGIDGHKESLTHTRPTGQETADRKKNKLKESVSINKNVPMNEERKISVDKACPVMCALQSMQRTIQCTSDQDDDTENTDSTSKWSELSGMCSQGQFQCHLSLAQSQQFIWEEELRARQLSALFRLRKKALWERTQAELTWLEHCKKNALSEEDSVTQIKRKQEEVLKSLRCEEAEIHHWRNVYKSGQQQRHLLLYHHRDILDIKKSTTHIRQMLEKQAMTDTDSRPTDTASVLEGKGLITKPGIKPAARGEDKLPSKQGRQVFLTKAGLRRLLTADEVWSLGRKRSLGEHNIPTEQEILQTPGSKDSGDPKCFSAYSHRSKPCHNTSTERKVKREDGKPPHKQESLKANSKPHGYEPKPAKKVPKVNQTKSTEILSREKVHWKPLKDVHHFTSERNQPSCGTSDNARIVSCLSSDIEEDLPYDYEDLQQKPGDETESRFQEKLKPHSSSFEMTVDCGEVITDNLTLNVQNSHQLQSVVFNNNHEICDVSRDSDTAYTQTQEIDLVSQISENLKWQNIKDSMIDKPLVTNSVLAVRSDIKETDSPSCDDSLSEAEDKSEPFSLQSEGLVWSEEEKDVHSEEKSEAGTFALVYAEKCTVIPASPPCCHQFNNKHCEVDPCGLLHNEKQITTESNLSEILSPVDEVLSYGSAELPPSFKGGGGPGLYINSLAPPSPAFEIITWTSEEDLPGPPEFLEDTSINSENIPPLPVDLSCKRDTERPSETNVNNDVCNTEDLCQMLHSAEQDQDDEGSEYTSSLPVDDSKESQDPLSSFNIGDRVLVCNSRPGVLKYKGYTTFADGFWAGVALDIPNGNHNGTFRGVKYFTCQKSCGVLVRAEDISHLHREYCNDADTGMDQDTFSDEDPPNYQDGENGNKPSGKGQRWQSGRHCSPGHGSSAPKQASQQEPCENDEATDNKLPTSSERTPLNIDCMGHLEDSEALIERLTEEIFIDALMNIQETGSTHDSKSMEINFKKKEDGNVINKPRLMDKWQQVYPVTPPQIRVKPHEHSIVYRLVDEMVETLCGQANRSALYACEMPNYLVDDESRKTYRQVLYQLASDILNKICADILEMSGTSQKTVDKSMVSLVQTKQISVKLLKDAVKREIQKVLNLEQTDQEMTEMLQTLCKYWYAKRDRVDYILIQELHNEEKEWVDYSNDQITVKMRLANEIFSFLLDDTISVLNHIYSRQQMI